MGVWVLLKAGIKRQLPTIVGVGVLVALASLSLTVATSVLFNSRDYVSGEMDRLGYGDSTVWVSGVDDVGALASEISEIPGVDRAQAQQLIFAGYSANGNHSDDEGQLLSYDAETYPYYLLSNDLVSREEKNTVEPGTILVSPVLRETFDIQPGDIIDFELARVGAPRSLTVAGYFEDPFMGSSMIDMKSFLVSPADYSDIAAQLAQTSSLDVLGRTGAMMHVFQEASGGLAPLEFDRVLGQNSELAQCIELSYSRDTVQEFMLLQQMLLAGFLSLFAIALIVVALVVLGHSVASAIELERRDIAILKTLGFTSGTLRCVQVAQYGLGVGAGVFAGVVLGVFVSDVAVTLLATSAGLLIPADPQLIWCAVVGVVLLGVTAAVVMAKTHTMVSIPPIEAFGASQSSKTREIVTPLYPRSLSLSLALRHLASEWTRYIAIFAIATLLVFFVSAVGRINAWVGPSGEGLMDAFSAADHDVGIQPLNPTDMQSVEQTINQSDSIASVYSLAMQPVRVEGVAYTANVIDVPDRFHIVEGRTCLAPTEIVLTATVAADINKQIGDTVEVVEAGSAQSFEVVGIYQCANEMGANVGMSMEGYSRIGDVRGFIWCYHYLLAEGLNNQHIAAELQNLYGASAAVHTNGWSGLSSLVTTMQVLLALLCSIAAVLVLVSTALVSSKLLRAERIEMAICKSLGFTSRQLRKSFSLRIGMVSALGAIGGLLMSWLFADAAIASLLSAFGIGSFGSSMGLINSVVPALGIVSLSVVQAFLFSRCIKRSEPTELFVQFDE